MVFVRKKHKIEKEETGEQQQKDEKIYVDTPPVKTDEEIRNFREQAIKVLNILDSQGINIYDSSRRPDMYIRKRLNKESDVKIKRISEIVSKKENPDNEKENQISNSLLEAMLKSKTNNK